MHRVKIYNHENVDIIFIIGDTKSAPNGTAITADGKRIAVFTQVTIPIFMAITVNKREVYYNTIEITGSPHEVQRKIDKFSDTKNDWTLE